MNKIDLFVPGRLCLFGEHSDWAGEYRTTDDSVRTGRCIVAGTDQGIYGTAEPASTGFHISQILPDGSQSSMNSYSSEPELLRELAESAVFDSYAAGTAAIILKKHPNLGLRLRIHRRTLPMKKGLSSSAAVCVLIARAFNNAIANGEISAPIVLGRDHHDVSGTDSPYRETANIRDGSMFTADMAVQNVIGDSFRGATWVSLHNGGGVGWGEVINGGFGLLLDGSPEAAERASGMLCWDVSNGLARRSWARNPGAIYAIKKAMEAEPDMMITIPSIADESLLEGLFE